ncbi:alginate export family protein [Lentisalinibacter orientalis]|uniref:alginate export family protein n=1 Tax=Lentisalinibacter orientalis TaxID=2992241 RepID=UPI003869A1E7
MNDCRHGTHGNRKLALLAGFALTIASLAAAADDSSLTEAIAGGDAGVELRYRYEFVDQDGFDENANASTLRLRLNYETGEWRGFSAFAEFDQVMEVILDDFNSGSGTSSGERDQYPVVADPNGSDLNQLYFQYSGGDWLARLGRQRILLDDQRYVGGVGWRQNEQTYDGLSFTYAGFERTRVFYSYVANVNRIFGSDVPAGDHEQDTHLLNVKTGLTDEVDLVGYAYLIDNDDAPAFSTDTFGVRGTGALDLDFGRLALLGEYAVQSDAANNPASFDTDYFRLQAYWSRDAFSAGIGFESLGSDNGEGFRTPLATLHAFNGWADQFLATPGAGLEDLYLKGGYTIGGWKLQAVYHDFSAERGGQDYGSELDFSASTTLGGRYKLLLKAARFSADAAPFVDTTKMWIMVTTSFGDN